MNPALATAHDAYLLACVAGTVALLLLLVGRLRLHAALGLSVAALALGAVAGIPLEKVPVAFTAGAGAATDRPSAACSRILPTRSSRSATVPATQASRYPSWEVAWAVARAGFTGRL